MRQPAAYIQLEMYDQSVRQCGLASVTLPTVTYPSLTVSGAGLMGSMEVPAYGMVDPMTLSVTWLEPTGDAVQLAAPEKHQIDIRVATETWEVEMAEVAIQADRFVMIVQPKAFNAGNVAPMAAADTTSEFAVYYYAGYRDGQLLWEIDKRNQKCVILGTDYMDPVTQALGLK